MWPMELCFPVGINALYVGVDDSLPFRRIFLLDCERNLEKLLSSLVEIFPRCAHTFWSFNDKPVQ